MLSARRIVIDRSKKEQEIFRDPTDVLLPAASHFRFMCAGASPVQIHPCCAQCGDARAPPRIRHEILSYVRLQREHLAYLVRVCSFVG